MDYETYLEVYLSRDYEDPHTEIQKRTGLSRDEVKTELYKLLYSCTYKPEFMKEN